MAEGELVLRADEVEPPVEPVFSSVRFNAVTHGITSVSPVLPAVESERDWKRFQSGVLEELGPRGGVQLALADLVAGDLWRMMRITRFERESITTSLQRIRDDLARERRAAGGDELTLGLVERIEELAMARLLPRERDLEKVMRYRAMLQRHVRDNVEMIRVLQGKAGVRRRRRRVRGLRVRRELGLRALERRRGPDARLGALQNPTRNSAIDPARSQWRAVYATSGPNVKGTFCVITESF